MFIFLLGGIWNAIMCIITFFQLFDENTIELALATLPDYLVMVAACFSIFSLLLKIKNLEKDVDELWKIAEENGYSKSKSNPAGYFGNTDTSEDE